MTSQPIDREVLPTNVTPLHYDLSFEPDFKNFTFEGSANIKLRINDPTIDVLTLNTLEIKYHEVKIEETPASDINVDDKAQTVQFIFPKGTICCLLYTSRCV